MKPCVCKGTFGIEGRVVAAVRARPVACGATRASSRRELLKKGMAFGTFVAALKGRLF